MKKIFTFIAAALISVCMSAEEVIVFNTAHPRAASNVSYIQGTVTLNCSVAHPDGFFLNNDDMKAFIGNSDQTTIITKLEMIAGWWPNNHATVRANNTAPTTSSEELIVFDNINSNYINLYAECHNIQIKEVRVTLSYAPELSFEHVKIGDLYYNLDTASLTAAVTWEKKGDTTNYHGLREAVIDSTLRYGGAKFTVTAVGNEAFRLCDSLTTVTLPESITSIGKKAFEISKKLETVVIPNSVTEIDEEAFSMCYGLKSVTLGTGLKTINRLAFGSCKSVSELVIPDNVEYIGGSAFMNCQSATRVYIGSGVKHLGDRAFQGSNALPAFEVASGNTIVCVEDGVLFNMAKDTLIQFPGGKGGEYIVPANVTAIGDASFMECRNLTAVTFPEGLTYLGVVAFNHCTGLTEIVLPNGVTNIRSAFTACSGLQSVTIGNAVTEISVAAFSQCSSLKNFTCHTVTPPALVSYPFVLTDLANVTLYVPAGTIEAYRAADTWKDFGTIAAISDSGEQVQTLNSTVNYLDRSGELLRSKQLTLHVPAAPVIEGFTFLRWQVVAGAVKDGVTIQAVYESDDPTAAPEVYTNPANKAQKLIRNGNVYILNDGKTYTITGTEVR